MRFRPLLGVCLVLTGFACKGATNEPSMLGFDRPGALKEQTLEAQFDASLNRDNLREWMRRLTAHPHHVGSTHDKGNAEFIAEQFRSWGYDTQIEEFEVLFPTPKTRLLEMTQPTRFTASLAEPPLKEDSTSGLTNEELPTYNAYSKDGDVRGELVYVNYGRPADYDELAQRGIDVKGKIVIARYGACWRGIKPKVAAEHGAIGCVIYSDPRDDGYFEGDVYPQGAWRNENGAQRGSVCDMPLYPGDPLTPGVGATKGAKRLPLQEAASLTKIPVLPISYADAGPLLRALQGPVAPEEWRGALPFTYHLGPGPATVHLKLEFNWQQAPLYDVIARLPGSDSPEEWVIRGNHHDAWVFGADDPISGAVAVMEEARAIAGLRAQGWKPKRTIVYTLWDGEEPCLLGSTEWAETHADALKEHATVYINSDSNGRGFLDAGGSHTLERFINEVARSVEDPETKLTVAERLRDHRIATASVNDRRELRARADLRIEPLGSGSDFTPLLQHLGIATLNLGYGGEDGGGSYHSIYDSFDYYTRFGDPHFDYGIALVRTAGRAVLRMANAPVLPYEFSDFADTVSNFVKEVSKLADTLREGTVETNRLIADKVLVASADPTKTFIPPTPKPEVPYLNFAPLQNALAALEHSAEHFEHARGEASKAEKFPPSPDVSAKLNTMLRHLEQTLTRPEGLPRRPWYQHLLYAPGFYTGYGVKTLPGVREAIEERKWTEATQQIEFAAAAIQNCASEIERGADLLKSDSR